LGVALALTGRAKRWQQKSTLSLVICDFSLLATSAILVRALRNQRDYHLAIYLACARTHIANISIIALMCAIEPGHLSNDIAVARMRALP
jgi:hypothetical protein